MGTAENEVSDPTDWLDTSLSSLSTLDSALRCQVCKEFYDTPMITSCSHTFCSLCIRRCLSSDGKCPTCRSEDQSSKLRRNWTVQECVDAFASSRKAALELARSSREDDHPKRKRRKISGDDETQATGKPSPTTRRTRSSARIGEQARAPASGEIIVVDSEDEGEDIHNSAEQEQEIPEPDDGLVACPMCGKRMKEEAVFTHLDRCDGQQTKDTPPPLLNKPVQHPTNPGVQKRTVSPAKHLPHLNYSLLRDQALRKKLQELGIPTFGSRQLLIRRHTQWVDIFNANSDSPRPKKVKELLRDLDVWERTQGGHAPGQGQTGPVGVMRKDFDGGEWTGRHKNQFDDLIAQARAKRKTAAASTTDTKDEQETSTKDEQKTDEAMEGIVTPITATPLEASTNTATTMPTTQASPKIGTELKPTTSALSDAISSSPIASMLHSAAQDVRRRTSIPGGYVIPTTPGMISTHSIPSASPTPGMQTPRLNGNSTSPRRSSLSPVQDRIISMSSRRSSLSPVHDQQMSSGRRSSLAPTYDRKISMQSETLPSLAERLGTETEDTRQVPMFKVPSYQVNDVEGLERGQ